MKSDFYLHLAFQSLLPYIVRVLNVPIDPSIKMLMAAFAEQTSTVSAKKAHKGLQRQAKSIPIVLHQVN
jgi:hypothetical protein